MINIRRIYSLIITVSLLFSMNSVCFGMDEDFISVETCKKYLKNIGFEEEYFQELENESDILQIYNILNEKNLNEVSIESIKENFKQERTINSFSNPDELLEYEIIDGMVQKEEFQFPVPNRINLNGEWKEESFELKSSTKEESTGAHVITYTKPRYKFFQETGFIDLPDFNVKDKNTVPYMMFGAYQKEKPYKGFDAGICYYKEKDAWKLFINNGKWYEHKDIDKYLIEQDEYSEGLYLDLKFYDGYAIIKVRDADTMKEIDRLDVYIDSGFDDTPKDIELTREVAMAQHSRDLDGSWIEDAHWSKVYLYSKDRTTKSKERYLQDEHPRRYSYSNKYDHYLIGDIEEDVDLVKIRNGEYYEEYVDIEMKE